MESITLVSFFFIIFGMIIGSFLNVVIYRLPRGESLAFPSSHCPNCNHPLRPFDLIPIFSFLLLKGKCRYCKTPIRWRYPLVEFITAFLTVLCVWKFGINYDTFAYLLLSYVLIAIAFIDFDHQLIPDWLTLPTLGIGLIYKFLQGQPIDGLVGALAGGGLLFIIFIIYPNGMGFGDVKFLTMTGVFLGWQKVVYSLFLGSVVGIIVFVPLILLKKHSRRTPFAFGPFLVIATFLLIFLDKLIIFWPFSSLF